MAHGYTFLVVDDEEDGRVLTRYSLLRGFPASSVVECSSVEEALDVLGHVRFDSVITDHHLGAGDANVLIRRAREKNAKCPILMITASSDPAVHRRAYDAGATQVFADGRHDFVEYLRSALL